jgi:hypothetical protein
MYRSLANIEDSSMVFVFLKREDMVVPLHILISN